jgi:hypothetical protein
VSVLRELASFGLIVSLFMLVGVWLESESRLRADGAATSFVGEWTLNHDLSDNGTNSSSGERTGDGSNGGAPSGGGRRHGGGGYGRGGGGGFGRGGAGAGGGTYDREEMQRRQNALRDIMNPPERLTIVQTDTLVVITGPDGRTTRLSPDGKKIKDESTKMDRKTKWDGGKLVSEISGLGSGTITETYSVDPEHHQLRIVDQIDNPQPRKTTHVYDADAVPAR